MYKEDQILFAHNIYFYIYIFLYIFAYFSLSPIVAWQILLICEY